MRLSKSVMLSASALALSLLFAQSATAASNSHEIQSFFSDSIQYSIGSKVPAQYRTKPYEIVEWQKRNLPAPAADTHWTYIGGNYALITNADGTITKAESGDIFFQ